MCQLLKPKYLDKKRPSICRNWWFVAFLEKFRYVNCEKNDLEYREYQIPVVFQPGMTSKAAQRTPWRLPGEVVTNYFLMFEAQLKKQYTVTRGLFLVKTVQTLKKEFIFQNEGVIFRIQKN